MVKKFRRDLPLELTERAKSIPVLVELTDIANERFYEIDRLNDEIDRLKNEIDHLTNLYESQVDAYIDLLEEHRSMARKIINGDVKTSPQITYKYAK